MATTANPPPGAHALEDYDDPFVASSHDPQRHRYGALENSQSLYLSGSPEQARRVLQAHLSETTRRLQETSHLGKSLVQQKQELEDKLHEVGRQEDDGQIGPELRRRLAELEKEFNEVGRETARQFMPRSRVPSGETDTTAGASVYSSEAQHSPSKISAPSRKQRNQQPSRINDIALATEISTSLLSQLKDLQSVLKEKDEALKAADLDLARVEIEKEGINQQLRALNESDQRLKDENWDLDIQVRELRAQGRDAADKESRLNHNLNLARSEKSTLEREFEELKQLYARHHEEQASKDKHHDTEVSSLKRDATLAETERGALERKVRELTTQNQELAREVAHRTRVQEQAAMADTSPDDAGEDGDIHTPDESPPPSPSKATPRHGMLESETLKHSLHHAHRMIQQLKNNIHREKTEKIELKRMLQDARDELESNRNSANGPGSANKRKKNDKDVFKKPVRPDRLGALRIGGQEVVVDDEDDWEEQDVLQGTPSRRLRNLDTVPGSFPGGFSSAAETSDAFETANEASDAFETANERDGTTTETDAFQTGAETLDGDSTDDLTETEGPSTDTVRVRPSPLAIIGNRNSYQSTASTSGDDEDMLDVRTPVQSQHPRYRLKLRQAGYRRSTRGSQEILAHDSPAAQDSPASFGSTSNHSTPAQGKSLFAELGALSGESEDGSVADGTPIRSSILSPESSPEISRKPVLGKSPLQSFIMPKPAMVDSSMMTEPWEPKQTQNMALGSISTTHTEPQTPVKPTFSRSTFSVQATEPKDTTLPPLHLSSFSTQETAPQQLPRTVLHLSSFNAQETLPRQVARPALLLSSFSLQETAPKQVHQPSLGMSSLRSLDTTPRITPMPSLNISNISAHSTKPVSPEITKAALPLFGTSSISEQASEPLEAQDKSTVATPLQFSHLLAQDTAPVESSRPIFDPSVPLQAISRGAEETTQARDSTPLRLSSLYSQTTEPYGVVTPKLSRHSTVTSLGTNPVEPPRRAPYHMSAHSTLATEPLEAAKPARHQMSSLYSQSTEPRESSRPSRPQFSSVSFQATEPVKPPRSGPLGIAIPTSQFSVPLEPPRRTISHLPAFTTQHTSPIEAPRPSRPLHRFSDVVVVQDTQPESPTLPAFLPSPSRPSTAQRIHRTALSLSNIFVQETAPTVPSRPVTAQRNVPAPIFGSSTSDNHEKAKGSKLGFFSSVLPWSQSSTDNTENQEMPNGVTREGRVPLGDLASNAVQGSRSTSPVKAVRAPMSDEGTQTMVSAEQIDRLLVARSTQRHSGTLATAGVEKHLSPPASPRRNSNDPNRTPRRPGSSGSIRSRAADQPPLPLDHKEVIAAAALKSPPLVPGTQPTTPGAMGPPVMPASAYKKRPHTPTIKTNNAMPSPRTGGTTPRARQPARRSDTARSGASSPISRRSSISSFASEIDHRINPTPYPFGQDPGFDLNAIEPMMLQAITQTMIGEFMWKYTRKAGREGVSEKRHRRFFWIHPYTRTLYWSEEDPAQAGRAQSKAKSVAIEAVQIVTDDNPYPPGLHRKSLVVITPGRTIQFTATTSQRHDTWFNAISYLLRKVDGGEAGEQKTMDDEVQNEFNGGYRSSSRQTGRSRASLTSWTSRRTSSPHHQIPTLHRSPSSQRPTSTEPPAGRFSSLSGKLSVRPTSVMRGSFASWRSGRSSAQGSTTYEQPQARDSRADMMQDILKANEAEAARERETDRIDMVNVRACCDGKHDVGDLHHHHHSQKGRHGSYNKTRRSLAGSMSSRSHSRAESFRGRDDQIHHQTELEAANAGAY
ncbi:hypothetical protein K491DRAFT_595335 [Lophiostoma macrostomum CBS 122681]|uniref:PH domain-containing protein n=1 Tax=Lophiostoma macrostomum CBS 122681 TaxID=1314788 RepID=A0A6A6TB71_9PLEO|nr:hypothetical protein K491DRAFT_595335 [Lophiostoma macrostomum CBS 122681]